MEDEGGLGMRSQAAAGCDRRGGRRLAGLATLIILAALSHAHLPRRKLLRLEMSTQTSLHDLPIESIQQLKIKELRARLQAMGMSTQGMKQELVTRLKATMQAQNKGEKLVGCTDLPLPSAGAEAAPPTLPPAAETANEQSPSGRSSLERSRREDGIPTVSIGEETTVMIPGFTPRVANTPTPGIRSAEEKKGAATAPELAQRVQEHSGDVKDDVNMRESGGENSLRDPKLGEANEALMDIDSSRRNGSGPPIDSRRRERRPPPAPTDTLFIKNMKRPYMVVELRKHLANAGYGTRENSTEEARLLTFWVSGARDICYVQYTSAEAAQAARASMVGKRYPPENELGPRLFIRYSNITSAERHIRILESSESSFDPRPNNWKRRPATEYRSAEGWRNSKRNRMDFRRDRREGRRDMRGVEDRRRSRSPKYVRGRRGPRSRSTSRNRPRRGGERDKRRRRESRDR